jgi:hypothetical protein
VQGLFSVHDLTYAQGRVPRSAFLRRIAINSAIFHYEIDSRRGGDVLEGIAWHRYDVGEFTRGDHSEIRSLKPFGSHAGGGLQSADGSQSCSHHRLEFENSMAERKHPAIGTVSADDPVTPGRFRPTPEDAHRRPARMHRRSTRLGLTPDRARACGTQRTPAAFLGHQSQTYALPSFSGFRGAWCFAPKTREAPMLNYCKCGCRCRSFSISRSSVDQSESARHSPSTSGWPARSCAFMAAISWRQRSIHAGTFLRSSAISSKVRPSPSSVAFWPDSV